MISAEQIKKMAWLCFVIGKIKILPPGSEDITETAFLLLSVLHTIVMLLPQEVECKIVNNFLASTSASKGSNGERVSLLEAHVTNHLLQAFKISGSSHEVDYF